MPYNRFVKTFSKTYKGPHKGGAMMKAAGRAWKKKTGKPKAKGGSKSASSKRKTSVANKGKMFRTLGTAGALEDFAWGFGGLLLMGQTPAALPTIRLVQGIQGHVLGRVGKGRLVYALIDLADLIIAKQASVQSIFDNVKQLTKIAPL